MASETWTPDEEALARKLYEEGQNSRQVEQEFRLRGWLRSQKSIIRKKAREGWHHKLPPSPTPRYNSPLVVEGDAVVLADVHAPYHDARWIDRVLSLALRWGVTQCIIAGDLADFTSFSTFQREAGIDADMELDTLSRVMDAICADFEVWYFAGNHDTRPIQRLREAGLSVRWIMQMFTPSERCHISDYYWCRLISGDVTYQIEHPKNTSAHAAVVPAKMAAIHRCSIIGAHGHRWGMSRDVSSRDWAIDSGICADPLRLAYRAQRHNTAPADYQGAVIVVGGVPILLGVDNIGFYESRVA